MKEFRVLKLGTECRDRATELSGTLTHWLLDMGGIVLYLFQPRGLDDKGQPLNKKLVCAARLDVDDSDCETVEVPFEILGTTVTDKASGFTGMAVNFVRHINGCFHVAIQPKGTLPGDHQAIEIAEFDLRGCKGKAIRKLSEAEQKRSEEKNPSPTGDTPSLMIPH